jgi:16S rRNA C967 or C1407 C5-methylase (RsmB/RsmF family)
MTDVSKLLLKLSNKLFAATHEQAAFIQALIHPQPYPSCILRVKGPQEKDVRSHPNSLPFSIEPSLPWQPTFIDRIRITEKPGAHPLHEAGAYYCLDFSSVFAASVIEALSEPPKVVMDICAAPGGKSIFAWQRFRPEQLVSNETIGKRVGMLIGNLKRCHIHPAIVLSTDPSQLSLRLPQTANLVLVDAPCSGQSLLAKGGQAEGCFHPVTIKQNAQRQKRILAHAAQVVAPQGYLVYMTCTFSPEENEQVGQWLLRKFPQLESRPVKHLTEYQSHLTDLPCYRMWPQSGLGAGAFAMLFQNTETGPTQPLPTELWPGWRWGSAGDLTDPGHP